MPEDESRQTQEFGLQVLCARVLVDSEGTGDTSSEDYGDRQIFTLTVLVASLVIYNLAGVPTRHDVEQLKYPLQLPLQKDFNSQKYRS